MRFYPFVFTGKEKDEETGYGYFGARYMDHELMTMWLSVDPLADKHPSISTYAYCAWNPVRLVDPDGRDFDPESEAMIADFEKKTKKRIESAQTERERNELQQALDELTILKKSDQMYHIEYGTTSSYNRKGETDYDIKNNRVRIIIAYDGDEGDIAHELKHAYQFETGDLSFDSRSGGIATAVLYDITDEEAAYRRGAAYGKEIPKNLEWHEKFSYTNSITGEKGLFYPFLQNEKVKLPDIGAGRNFPASSKQIHGRSTSVNNIYRYGGTTYKK